jgi:hypothetical protein
MEMDSVDGVLFGSEKMEDASSSFFKIEEPVSAVEQSPKLPLTLASICIAITNNIDRFDS